jgi:predicted MFS family arabinose efflux permease
MREPAQSPHDRKREIKIVALMALGFGLVGIDRFMISALFPVIARDLDLSYGDIGTITGALALAWGAAALFMGNLSDRIGRRRVLVASLVVFSLLIGTSGLAGGLMSLVLVRVMMGFADGAYTPVSISATLEASKPGREGLNIGVQQTMLPLFGLGFAPLIIAELMHVIDWRWIFSFFAAPGLLLAWWVWRTLPDPENNKHHVATAPRSSWSDWREVVQYRNIRLGMGMMLCWLTCLITTSALMPSYLTDHHHLDLTTMSRVMSSIGLGAMFGTILLPWLSDYIGRKPVMILSTIGTLAAMLLLANEGDSPVLLFAWLFMVHFFNNALITLTVGPLCSETVPASLMATASGVVIATGELFGGGIAPILAGFIADQFSIGKILYLPIAALAVAIVLSLLLTETRGRPIHSVEQAAA